MQGLHTQALRLQMGLNRQHAMFYDILIALQRRKEACNSVETDTLQLKNTLKAKAKPKGSKAKINHAKVDKEDFNIETTILRVNLLKSGGQVLLYKGQWIRTPFGDGQILELHPLEEKIHIRLSFGVMYANLSRVVRWDKCGDDNGQLLALASDETLRQRWFTLQQKGGFSLPPDVSRGVKELIGEENEDANTDKDDDSNDDVPFVIQENGINHITGQGKSINQNSSSNNGGKGDTSHNGSHNSNSTRSSSVCFPLRGVDPYPPPSTSSSSTFTCYNPMNSTVLCRDILESEISSGHADPYSVSISENMPLILAPPSKAICLL